MILRPLRYWRSTSQFEVDALVGEDVAIEIKSSDTPSEKHLRGLRALKEEGIFKRYILVCYERQKRKTEDAIEIIPWQQFTRLLWDEKTFVIAVRPPDQAITCWNRLPRAHQEVTLVGPRTL